MKERKYRELVELKGLIRQKKMTYQGLADLMGISLSALCDKINGFSIFLLTEVAQIAKILEISIDKIVFYFF